MEYLLGQQTRDRLMRLLSNQGAVAELRAGPPRPSPAPWVVVRCTSATAVGGDAVRDQCYPAVLLDAAANEVAPLPELADCLLTLLGEDGDSVAPTAGRCYAGVLTGNVSSDGAARPRVFACEAETGGGGSAITYSQSQYTDTTLSTNNTWVACGTLSLAAGGTYFVYLTATAIANVSAGANGRIWGRITGATGIGLNEAFHLACTQVNGVQVECTTSTSFVFFASTGTTLTFEAQRISGVTWTAALVQGPPNGKQNVFGAMRIA